MLGACEGTGENANGASHEQRREAKNLLQRGYWKQWSDIPNQR
jgi:hypothetical protein